MFYFCGDMLRIGRQIPHFTAVEPGSVKAEFSEDMRFRYLLSLKYGGGLYEEDRPESAAVVLKNPSAADIHAADTTVRKVETYVHRHMPRVGRLCILNLFALRATDAAELNQVYRMQGAEAVIGPGNDARIAAVLEGADRIIVAWGNRSGIDAPFYEERVRQLRELILGRKKCRVYEVRGKKETAHPLHGMMWGYEHKLVPARLLNEGS